MKNLESICEILADVEKHQYYVMCLKRGQWVSYGGWTTKPEAEKHAKDLKKYFNHPEAKVVERGNLITE